MEEGMKWETDKKTNEVKQGMRQEELWEEGQKN